MRVPLYWFSILGLFLLLFPLLHAQESPGLMEWDRSSRDANRSVGELVRIGIGLPESVFSFVSDSVRTLFLRFPKDQITIIPDSALNTPEAIPLKLKSGLAEDTLSNEVVRVNIVGYPQSLDVISARVTQSNGMVIHSFKVGSIVTAQLPRNQLLNVASEPQVKSIWPDRDFRATLDSSVNQIHVPALWGSGYTGMGQVVAVLDTGIDSTHPMLQGKVLQSVNFTPDSSSSDATGHGTHVAGIIAGKKSGPSDYNGVAPDAQLWNLKVLDNTGHGAESWIVAGINYAVDPNGDNDTSDGVKIINMSLGGPYTDPNSPIVAAVESAVSRGVVVVIASGNCGPGCPSSDCQGFVGVETPGDAPSALTVGAVDDASQWACFSGGGLVSNGLIVKPDLVAPGVNVSSAHLGGSLASLSGTSAAAPHVSGLVALLLQANPGITPQNVKSLLEQTAIDYGDPGKDTKYGSGLVDAQSLLPSSVLTLLKYSLSLSNPVLDKGGSESFTITSVSDDVYSVTLDVNAPNGLVENVSLSKNGLTWTGSFSNTSLTGTYLVTATVTNLAQDVTTLKKSFAVKSPSTTGQILGHSLPAQVLHNQVVNVSLQFQNTGSFDTEVLVELQEWKGDYFEKIRFSDPTLVSAGQTVSIPLSWTPQSSIGEKTIKLVATFDATALEVDQNVLVTDVDAPILLDVNAPASVNIVQPLAVTIRAGDISPLSGTLNVSLPGGSSKNIPLFVKYAGDFNQTLSAYFEPTLSGSHSFTVQVCDSASPANCVSSSPTSFSVSTCSSYKLLVFRLGNPQATFSFLNPPHCVGYWETLKQLPSASFLNGFSTVYWDAGPSYSNVPDDNMAELLLNYPGNIILEGDEIGLHHVNSPFLSGIGHATLHEDLYLDVNSTLDLGITTPHMIWNGISSPLPLSISSGVIWPDTFNVDNNGVSLAGWDANGSGVVAYQQGEKKHLLVGFSTSYLPPSVRQSLIQNIFAWMTVRNKPDVLVESIFPDVNVTSSSGVGGITLTPIPHFLKAGSNTIPFRVKNVGNATASNMPIDVRVDGVTVSTVSVSLLGGEAKDVNATVSLVAGNHTLSIYPNPSVSIVELNTLNNPSSVPIWVAPSQSNAVPSKVEGSYSNNTLTLTTHVSNLGGATFTNMPVQIQVDSNILTFRFTVPSGTIGSKTTVYTFPKKNFNVAILADPANAIVEAIESDNALSQKLYFCTKSNVLVVNDDDAQPYWSSDEDFDGNVSDLNASSAPAFEKILKDNGYCTTTWNQSSQGVPDANTLNAYPVVIWTAGDYWNMVLDANDLSALSSYTGSIWMEGNDVGFDHADDNAFVSLTHADFNGDILSVSETMPLLFNTSVFPSLSVSDFNFYNASFPDAFIPVNGGFSAGDWNNGKSALVGYLGEGYRTLTQGFSLDSFSTPADQNKLVADGMKWLLLASNQPPSPPSSLQCNGSPCAGHYSNTISLACSGSVDPEGDSLSYSLEASLSSSSGNWWNVDWSHRIPITISMSGAQSSYRTSIDLDSSTLSDPVFWNTVKNDFGDVRFVKDGTLLDYYRPVHGSDFASYWVEFDASDGNNLIEMYFGNASASYDGRTNPTDFFLTGPQHLVDNFDDGDLSGWTTQAGSWQASGGYLQRTGGGLSTEQITRDWLQQGSSFYIRAQARPTSVCPNTEIALTRDLDHSAPTYLDEFFGLNVDNACPDPFLTALTDLDHSPGAQKTLSIGMVVEDAKTEALISRTGYMMAFISDVNAAPYHKVVGWTDANHWYPYLSVGNHGGAWSEADEIYTGNAPNHAYDIDLAFGSSTGNTSSSWQGIGNHDSNASFAWDISGLGTQPIVSLRCRAMDGNGSGKYSSYYTADQNISIN